MKISEVAKLSGITVRTLHYYDEIGLLKPNKITEAGYRVYSNEDLETLQQILFFRELDFQLNEIKEIMMNPNYDKNKALNKHKELLIEKRERLKRTQIGSVKLGMLKQGDWRNLTDEEVHKLTVAASLDRKSLK